jgi:hypothetical protein
MSTEDRKTLVEVLKTIKEEEKEEMKKSQSRTSSQPPSVPPSKQSSKNVPRTPVPRMPSYNRNQKRF